MIFDTHSHYDDEAFDKDREALLESLPQNGISHIVNIGASIETTKNTIELTNKYDFIYGAAGVHPSETAELNEENFAWLREVLKLPKIVAVGEIGLDYFWDTPDRQIQRIWFERQMELAKEVGKPMVIHSRDAAKETFDMIVAAGGKDIGGVIHCYSSSLEMAKEYVKLGFYIGIGGVLTFKNAKKLKEVVEYLPIEYIVLETDCPYLSPEPNRGKRNSSLNLSYVVETIAQIKGMHYEEVAQKTNQNAKALYRL
ncbi:MAG: TatD family hydrolase [Clostridiales bacterium]|nr:TatD family hydrolase [Clostridiales bacterium]